MPRAQSKLKTSLKTAGRTNGLDVLAFGTHPDDLEIACGGTLIALARKGYRVGAADLTRGELGTRGTAAIRARETAAATRILGLSLRVNLGIPDGNIELSQENLMAVIRLIRQHRPWLILAPYWEERHYDHVHASQLISEAAFYAGLAKIQTDEASFRPFRILYYVSRIAFKPSFVVDVSKEFEARMKAIRCYRSQFHQEKVPRRLPELETMISTPLALEVFETMTRYYGAMIGARHGEPFVVRQALEISDPVHFFRAFPDSRQAHLFPPP
ncbi:MAG: bacillithiol biosynthesis deacetylase BshB1 [Acidobacteria bacterium]|nr:bacillithiol biosynthesis deacetylase BshB1 [Acidobacteriota bacterium]